MQKIRVKKSIKQYQNEPLYFSSPEKLQINYRKTNQPWIFPYAMIMEVGDHKGSIEISSYSNGIADL